MISVLTVTKRVGWEKLAIESIKAQTTKHEFEWIVITENDVSDELKSFATMVLKAPPKKEGMAGNLEQSTNMGLRHCNGDYVIFYQDFIILEDDCFDKLINLAGKKTLVTTLTANPEGEQEDPRYTWQDDVRECFPEEWEINVGLAPMGIIKELGGFDEAYDAGWAWGNCNLALRAEMLGCNFLLDETNRPQLIYHKKEPDARPELRLNKRLHDKTIDSIRSGKLPLSLDYL